MRELDEAGLLERATSEAQAIYGPDARMIGLEPLPGGVSSLTFRSEIELPVANSRPVVVKVAPPGLAPVRHRDVLRQARLLKLLAAHARRDPAGGIPVPDVVFEQDGDPPFFVMDRLPGVAEEPATGDPEPPPEPAVVRARALAAAQVLARMQRIPLGELGLADEDRVTVENELERWVALMETIDDDLCPGHEELRRELQRSIPDLVAPVLLHGDYRLGNLLFREHELSGVIDWEIWSVGDPRTDLAWLMMNTRPAHRLLATRSPGAVAAERGMPSSDEVLAEHQAHGGPEAEALGWFVACCYYKTAATLGAVAKRNRRAGRDDPDRLVLRDSLPRVVERGLAVARQGLSVLDRP